MPKNQKTRKQRGGAATSLPQSFFAPTTSGLPSLPGTQVSTNTTSSMIRPALMSQRGGYKKQQKQKQKNYRTRKMRGGFSPTVMGPFLKNVEALAAPLSIYLGYKLLQTLKGKKGARNRI